MDPRKSGQAGTSCRADDYLSNLDCAALRAMTGLKWEDAVMLFFVFMQLLERCGAFGDVHRNEFRCYKIFRA